MIYQNDILSKFQIFTTHDRRVLSNTFYKNSKIAHCFATSQCPRHASYQRQQYTTCRHRRFQVEPFYRLPPTFFAKW